MAIEWLDGFETYGVAAKRGDTPDPDQLKRRLDLAASIGFRLAVAQCNPFVALDPDARFLMLAPGERPPRRHGVRWSIWEQVGGEWRERSA